MAFGNHQKRRLADVADLADRQQRLVMRRGAAIRHFGEILGRQHRHHAGGGADGGQVHAFDCAMRDGGQTERQMQRPRQGKVIHIPRLPRHMQRGCIMRQGFSQAHARTPSTDTGTPERSWK